MVDGFYRYNHISFFPEDREKMIFTTPWGTLMYAKIPFGLMNAGETFQRAMDIAFIGERDKFVFIYLDDITIFSRYDKENCYHMKKVFLNYRRFGLSLNPKKSLFPMKEGNLLGHIVLAKEVKINPRRVEAIQSICFPRSRKEVQYFLGKINFLRRLISNFVEFVKYITTMLRKGNEVKWTVESRNSFNQIKRDLNKFYNPNFHQTYLPGIEPYQSPSLPKHY
jgi:hypothetical protein